MEPQNPDWFLIKPWEVFKMSFYKIFTCITSASLNGWNKTFPWDLFHFGFDFSQTASSFSRTQVQHYGSAENLKTKCKCTLWIPRPEKRHIFVLMVFNCLEMAALAIDAMECYFFSHTSVIVLMTSLQHIGGNVRRFHDRYKIHGIASKAV